MAKGIRMGRSIDRDATPHTRTQCVSGAGGLDGSAAALLHKDAVARTLSAYEHAADQTKQGKTMCACV
jgi:hypothetical protein